MISGLILASALQIAGADEVECTLTAEGMTRHDRSPTSLSVDCPDDVVDASHLQEVADYAVGLIPLDLDRDSRLEIAETVRFDWSAQDSWKPIAGQRVIDVIVLRGRPRSVENGYHSQACSYAIWPNANGRPGASEIHCMDSYGRPERFRRIAERRMLAAIGDMRFLPVDASYCFQAESFVEIAMWRDRSRGPDTPPPLPMICDRQVMKNGDRGSNGYP
jgi:hypothetical protein